MRRRIGFGMAAAVGGTLIALLVAELGVRVVRPDLPIQLVGRGDGRHVVGEGDGLHWRSAQVEARRPAGCPDPAARPRVLVQGSSILYGSGVEPEEAPGARLRAALQTRGVDEPCVFSLAHPAGTFSTQRAELAARPAEPAAVLLWELWQNSIHGFTRLGDTAYNFGQLELNADGVPDPFGMGPLARPLLRHSHLFTVLSLRRARRPVYGIPTKELWRAFAPTFVDGAQAAAARRGATLVVATFPSLDRPFADQFEANARTYGAVVEALRGAGVPVIEMDRALVGQDPEGIRLDRCCHYNAAGADVVAGILADRIAPLLTEAPDAAAQP